MGCGCCGHKYRQAPKAGAQAPAPRRPRVWSFRRPQGVKAVEPTLSQVSTIPVQDKPKDT